MAPDGIVYSVCAVQSATMATSHWPCAVGPRGVTVEPPPAPVCLFVQGSRLTNCAMLTKCCGIELQ